MLSNSLCRPKAQTEHLASCAARILAALELCFVFLEYPSLSAQAGTNFLASGLQTSKWSSVANPHAAGEERYAL